MFEAVLINLVHHGIPPVASLPPEPNMIERRIVCFSTVLDIAVTLFCITVQWLMIVQCNVCIILQFDAFCEILQCCTVRTYCRPDLALMVV